MSAHTDSSAAHRRGAGARVDEGALIARLAMLSTAVDEDPDPDFRAATRARLVAMAAVRTPEPAGTARARRWFGATQVETAAARWRSRLTAGLAGAAVAVTALAGLVAVSSSAQPGDPLYGLKRGTEQTALALASDSSRGQRLLDLASTRLAELDELLGDGGTALPAAPAGGDEDTVLAEGVDPQLVVDTLTTMDAQTTEGTAWLTLRAERTGSTALLDQLTDWATGQRADLAALQPEVPQGAETAMSDSLGLLSAVEQRGAALDTALSCAAGPATAGTDALGPLPADCTDPATPSTGVTPPTATGGTTPIDPGQPSAELPGSSSPAAPTVGGGTGGGSGGGSGGGTGGGLPQTTTPSVPSVPSVQNPLPSLPSVSLPSVSVPRLPLPTGSGTGGSPSTGGSSTGTPPPVVSICLGPIVLGNC